MGRASALWLGIAGLFLGGAVGFLVSRSVYDGGATRVLADALARESTIGPSVWPLAITAASSILAAVLLPLTVVMAVHVAGQKESNGRINIGSKRLGQGSQESRRRDRRVRAARGADQLGPLADPNRSDRCSNRLSSAPLQDRDRENGRREGG